MSLSSAAIAGELQLGQVQVESVLELLSTGATIPFIARYRKEATGGLDEVALAAIEDRQRTRQALGARRKTILKTLDEAGKLTNQLRQSIEEAPDLQRLEDLYEPHKVRRRTRAEAARELGLAPLADLLLGRGQDAPEVLARQALDRGVKAADVAQALDGARDIIAERVALDPDWREAARTVAWRHATLTVAYRSDAADEKGTYRALDGFSRPVGRMPADRVLAAFRGERDKQLRIRIALDADRLKQRIARQLSRRAAPACREWLAGAVDDAWARLLWPKVQVDIRRTLRERSELASIEVFARNLEALLMQPPLGPLAVLGIDPGYRTGCKVAAIDGTGRFLDSATVYPTPPRKDVAGAVECVGELARRAGAKGLAVGNGTGGRETLQALGAVGLPVHLVNEAGASVYSASAVARREFPDLDLTIRGAISIGRRLQDPLAELVKIEPRSIGVGQYQHDVDQTLLGQALDRVVERVVNRVGVHLNTASVELLCHVSGLNRTLAEKIVAHRDQHGPFRDRGCLLGVTGLGPRTFEQAAGFMRIPEGGEPLDSTGIHPESYPVVREIARAAGCRPADLVGSAQRLIGLDPQDFVTSAAGLPTVEDIFEELARPGRDPRGEARQQAFDERVRSIEDLEQGQELPGVVTNVAQFGAFVDIGVKKDGLIHVSSLSRPVSIGEWMRVRVTQIDSERQRISLVPV